jgi:hypothetical protein
MKYTLVLLFSILFLWNCKNESKDSSPTSNTETPIQENIKPVTEEKSVDYQEYYVAVTSGLRMRKSASLKGEKMDVVKYGEAIQVNRNDIISIPPVSGFNGNMVAVKYGDKEGYMFDGFLTKFPPPSKGQQLKQYVRKLKIQGFKATQKESFEEITATSELLLPTTDFQEAFLIAQRMGWITGKFDLPNPNAGEKMFVNHKDIKKTIIGVPIESKIGAKYRYTVPLPVYDEENQYFTIDFEQTERDRWHTFVTEVSKKYHYQKTTIQRKDDYFEIIYTETGE